MACSSCRRGFTLTEILVVIAIVIALAAVAFSLGGKATAAAKAATCTSNLRQINVMITVLREKGLDTGGLTPPGNFPPYAGQISAPSKWRKFSLYELMGEEAGLCEFKNGRYVWSVHPSETFLQDPLSKHRLGDTSKKTNEANKVNFQDDADSTFGSFGYNHLLEGWVAAHTPDPKRTRLEHVDFPARTIMMAEANPDVPRHPIWMGPYVPNRQPAGTYKDGAHCLFVDGHVELLKNDYLRSSEGLQKHFRLHGWFN